MTKIWTRKPIAALEAEAAEPEVQALTTYGSVPLQAHPLRVEPRHARHRRASSAPASSC